MDEPAFVKRLRGRAKAAMDQAHLGAAREEAAARRPEKDAARDAEEAKRKRREKPEPALKPRSARFSRRRLEPQAAASVDQPAVPAKTRVEQESRAASQSYFASLRARVRGEIANDNSLVQERFRQAAERER